MKVSEENITYKVAVVKIISAEYVRGYCIQIRFHDNTSHCIDFEPFLRKSQHPAIKRYLDISRFKNFKITDGNLNWNDYDMIFPLEDLYKGRIV